MRKVLGAACVLMLLSVSLAFAGGRSTDPLGVAVSPQTFILSMDQGSAVTVHTAIRFADVDTSNVTLDGIPAGSCWADSCGNLVARFPEASVKAIVAPPEAVLTLSGFMKSGEPFSGSDTVRVIP